MKRAPKDHRCQLMTRLRGRDEVERRRRFRYYDARIRLCVAAAVALVKFTDQEKPRRVCEHHLAAELTDRVGYWIDDRKRLEVVACPSREQEIEWFIPLQREHSPALALAEQTLVNRAPIERSWDTPDTRERRRRGNDRMT